MIPTDLEAALEQIAAKDNSINAFRRIDSDTARAHVANVSESAPLAGVPFAVKELFDVAGHTTLAGSIIEEGRPPAEQDATVVARCRDAGAVLVGTTNMDEYAFGFTTENTHRGPTRNPHDLERIAGGSSGGSAAAVASGMVPVAFGSDTNGSIRVPAALCGVYGHKPTFGRVSRAGARLFSPSLDHVGPFAADPALLAAVDRVVVGVDARDPMTHRVSRVPSWPSTGPRVARLGGWFDGPAETGAHRAVDEVAAALGATEGVVLEGAGRSCSAAMILTAVEAAALHLGDLRVRPADFDPMTRDRFLAGALVPASAHIQARRWRQHFRAVVAEALVDYDVLLAPGVPVAAPPIGTATVSINGEELPLRPLLGRFTQPISFAGLPVVSVPVPGTALPYGAQLIGAPHSDEALLDLACELHAKGVTGCPSP